MKHISIVGSTGSIGTQTLDVLSYLPVQVDVLTTNTNIHLLEQQVRKWKPKLVVAYQEEAAKLLKIALADLPVRVATGMDGLIEASTLQSTDTVVTAVVGMIGLLPTLSAIQAKKNIALANKETLVCAGQIVMEQAKQHQVSILPVDSEHSAIFQCLQAQQNNPIDKIILTASGGPFLGYTKEQLQSVTKEQALKHPNWSMGAKITIDSATLVNKSLELLEAMWLYDLPPEQIDVVVHRESIIHSIIEFCDGSQLAQLGMPDMRLPIQYALTYPKRFPCVAPRLSLAEVGKLTFATPPDWSAPVFEMARTVGTQRGNLGSILNAANEIAVDLFLHDQISFLDIYTCIAHALEEISFIANPTVDEILETDLQTRNLIRTYKGV